MVLRAAKALSQPVVDSVARRITYLVRRRFWRAIGWLSTFGKDLVCGVSCD